MTTTIFVDGHVGTTGLKIHERLASRTDLEILVIEDDRRKDLSRRRDLINAADFVILCLPDDAARESTSLVDPENRRTRILDASTAHRTATGWVYGFPELTRSHRDRVQNAARISVPGCHATGFIAMVGPLVQAGLIDPAVMLACTSLTGYSGGGKSMIADFEAPGSAMAARGASLYALTMSHKHLPEMQAHAGLGVAPTFLPIVGNFACGMIVSVPLLPASRRTDFGAMEAHQVFAAHYEGQRFIRVMPYQATPTVDGGCLDPTALNGTNDLELFVFGDGDRILVSARFDNLGKGASGAAIQNLNLMMGVADDAGLCGSH